jgi:hypothetical protein
LELAVNDTMHDILAMYKKVFFINLMLLVALPAETKQNLNPLR